MSEYPPPPAGPPSGGGQPGSYPSYPNMPPAGQQPYGGYPQGYGQGYGQPSRNGMGTASLILGILGIIPLAGLVIPNILAIVFGMVGRARAARGEATNRGAATWGLWLGVVGILVSVGVIVLVVHRIQHTTCIRYDDGTTVCHTS